MPTPPDGVKILLVEDNPIDVVMVKRALRTAGFSEPTVVDDGIPAIELLQRKNEFSEVPTPDLVILDLNLKKVDGPEVLSFIRQEPGLRSVCVTILSSSPTDVMVNRAAGANCYFSKPSDVESYRRLGRELLECYQSATGKAMAANGR